MSHRFEYIRGLGISIHQVPSIYSIFHILNKIADLWGSEESHTWSMMIGKYLGRLNDASEGGELTFRAGLFRASSNPKTHPEKCDESADRH